jgi:hypothetical protein
MKEKNLKSRSELIILLLYDNVHNEKKINEQLYTSKLCLSMQVQYAYIGRESERKKS